MTSATGRASVLGNNDIDGDAQGAAHLFAVVAALSLQADIGCVALIVGGVGGHIPAGQRIGRRSRAAQVLLAGAVLLEIH